MIIKKWDGSTSAWVAQSAITNATDLVVDVTAASPVSIFEIVGSTPKIKLNYLPNSVFDSLRFYAAYGTTTDLRNLGLAAVADATTNNRSAIGYYWVASAALNVSSGTGVIQVNSVYATTSGINPGEERAPGSQLNVDLEIGDWFVLVGISGLGTAGSPYSFTFAVINNTYELMTGAAATVTAGTSGLVPGAAIGQNLHFLRGDATWAIPTNTTYTVATDNGTDIYKEKINLVGSNSITDYVEIGVGATSLTQRAGTLQSNTIVLVGNTAGLLVGQLVTGTGIPANTLITNIVADTSITISNAATSSGLQTLTFSTFGLTIEQASDVITVRHADTSSAANLAVSSRRYVTGLTFDTFGHVIGYDTATETVVDTDTHHQAGLYAGATGTLTNAITTNGNTYIKLVENGAIRTSNLIQGSGATTVTTDVNGTITISSTDNNTTYTAGNGIDLSVGNEFTVSAGEGLTQEAGGLKMTYPVYHGDTLPTTGISANAIGLEW